ncbi:hypothetical protein FRB96_000929 [Tulasnella sp. 330]|nr:hypothetical protein FRB96_000929 [Tulasnella sp. 330]
MSKVIQLTLALTAALAAVRPVFSVPPGTIFCDIAFTTGTSVTSLQLTQTPYKAILTDSGFHGGWDFVNGGLGAFDGCHDWWLNIGTSPHSYKPLTWAFDDQLTDNWVGGPGQLLTATATADYATTSNFLACKEDGVWTLYLQTGEDVPPGKTCALTTLQEGASVAL